MENDVRETLEKKATEISSYLLSKGYIHTYRLIDYGINFVLRNLRGEHTLTISYSPKKRLWTSRAVNEWVQDVIIPQLQPLLGSAYSVASERAVAPKRVRETIPTNAYFIDARECLRILEPFAEENIDFSILYDFVRRGIQLMLKDPRQAHLDHSSLRRLLEQPSQSDFYAAKEYLYQCLTQCNIRIEN